MKMFKQDITKLSISVVMFTMYLSCSSCNDEKETEKGTYSVILTEISGYPIADTDQKECFNNSGKISPPDMGELFYGQDAQNNGTPMSYSINEDGKTVFDHVTGLTWIRSGDINDDGNINYIDEITYDEAFNYVKERNAETYGGFNDWRIPSIKELYSLMNFNGEDPSNMYTSNGDPFIDTEFFIFEYGDVENGDRIIDAQYWSGNIYSGRVLDNFEGAFGLNLADGRIKCYPIQGSHDRKRIMLCRGNTSYGINNFIDNGDSTITDNATGLMWSKNDCGYGMNWEEALNWVQKRNNQNYLGYNDWRMPNAKELQSIVDYTRSPAHNNSAAIDPVFNITSITNEAGEIDYPWFWTSTTHIRDNGDVSRAVYIAFGKATGYWNNEWKDVHGAGCQRSDPKTGDPDNFPTGLGPQGDAIRILNFVRCVRDAE